SNFVVKQARAIAGLGHEVVLAGYHALPLEELERTHRVPLAGVRSRMRGIPAGGAAGYRAQRRIPGKPSPYFALLDPRVRGWLASLGERGRPEVVWLHDDLPTPAEGWSLRIRRRLYAPFPLRARSASVAPPLRTTRGRSEAAQDAVLRRLSPRLVVSDPVPDTESIRV